MVVAETVSPLELVFIVCAFVGVITECVAVQQTLMKRRDLRKARRNGARMYFANIRIRQEVTLLVVQFLFLYAATTAGSLPAAEPQHESHLLARASIVIALSLIEVALIVYSIANQWGRYRLIDALDRSLKQEDRYDAL